MPTYNSRLAKKISGACAFAAVALTAFYFPGTASASPENIASVHGSGERGGVILTVSAIVKSNGETSGQAMFHDRNTNSKLSIDVDRVDIEFTDRTATISGEVTKVTGAYSSGFFVGGRATFLVEDNGEGADAFPDEFSSPTSKGGVLFLQDEDGGYLLPRSESGNLRVTGVETDK